MANASRDQIRDLAEKVKNRDLKYLETVVPETLLDLDRVLKYKFTIDQTFIKLLEQVQAGLDMNVKITELNNKLNDTATDPTIVKPDVGITTDMKKWLLKRIEDVNAFIRTLSTEINTRETSKAAYVVAANDLTRSNTERQDSKREVSRLEWEISSLRSRVSTLQNYINETQQKADVIKKEHTELNDFWEMYKDIIGTGANDHLRWRIGAIAEAAKKFNQTSAVPRFTVSIGTTPPATTGYPVNLQNVFMTGALPAGLTDSYSFVDADSNEPLSIDNGKMQVKLEGGQTVHLKNLTIAGNQLQAGNVMIDPVEGIKFPLTVKLSIKGTIQDSVTGIQLDNYKPLTITLNAPVLPLADRQAAYRNLDTALGANTINNRISSVYSANNVTRENEVIRDILKAGGNKEEVEKIYANEELRGRLLERIRNLPGLIPVLALPTLQTGFASHITDPARKVPAQYLTSVNAFTDFLRNDMEKNIQTYLKDTVKGSIERRTPGATDQNSRDKVIATFMQFVTDVQNNKLENDDHMQLLWAIPADEPTRHADSFFQRLFGRSSAKNNYTKFFTGREATVDKQVVEIAKKNVNYSLHLKVHGVNKMTATIKLDGVDEPIIIDAPNHNTLVKAILAREATKDGDSLSRKARCHMAVAAMKALVQMSPTTLHREFNGQVVATNTNTYNVDRVEAFVKSDNLVLRANCTAAHGNRTRENQVIFDEKRYKNMHNIDELENGVVALSQQLNGIMDAMGTEFNQVTNGVIPSLTNSEMNYDTRFPMRFWWAKSLYGRIRYGETNNDFSFTTSATEGGKTANITFHDGVFTITGTFKDKPYTLEGTNLGKILRTKQQRERIFDGIELAIVEKVNEEMIKQLRTNHFVAPENFAVSDFNTNKTGKVYILDASGNLSYLEIEDRAHNPLGTKTAGVIPENTLPPQRIRCNEKERKDFMQNPLLAGRLVRQMRLQLALF